MTMLSERCKKGLREMSDLVILRWLLDFTADLFEEDDGNDTGFSGGKSRSINQGRWRSRSEGSDCVHPFVALQKCIKANSNYSKGLGFLFPNFLLCPISSSLLGSRASIGWKKFWFEYQKRVPLTKMAMQCWNGRTCHH
ncbi:hypothetical protein Scep_007477 [Stephania cephalantha]|uniref:Uncharacterized protein n=1 Tax=Stephania cephalantha TaxID=152367 RepID=A0AAP0PNW3_9MAGN